MFEDNAIRPSTLPDTCQTLPVPSWRTTHRKSVLSHFDVVIYNQSKQSKGLSWHSRQSNRSHFTVAHLCFVIFRQLWQVQALVRTCDYQLGPSRKVRKTYHIRLAIKQKLTTRSARTCIFLVKNRSMERTAMSITKAP